MTIVPSITSYTHTHTHIYIYIYCAGIWGRSNDMGGQTEQDKHRFDVWIGFQHHWVYLKGIFTGSTDSKHMLPIDSQRFCG